MKNKNSFKTLLKFPNGVEIKADQMCWAIFTPSPRNYFYYSTLGDALTDLLNLRIKELASGDERKTVKALAQSIDQAHQEMKEIINVLTSVKIPEYDRLELIGSTEDTKDD